jgi:hypothetical protein
MFLCQVRFPTDVSLPILACQVLLDTYSVRKYQTVRTILTLDGGCNVRGGER